MVNALNEAERVVRTGGTLIDLRPIADDAPIEIVTPEEVVSVARVDGSPGLPHDKAADDAVKIAIGKLPCSDRKQFRVAVYWDSVAEMVERLDASSRHLKPTPREIESIARLFDECDSPLGLRFHETMRLTSYHIDIEEK